MRSARAAAVAVASTLLLSACTDGSSAPDASGSASPTARATPTSLPAARVPPPPKPPQRTACYRLTSGQLTRPSNSSPAVRCSSRHTARTVFVGRLDTVERGRTVRVDSAVVQRRLSTTCSRKLASYVGGSAETRDLSRLDVVWFTPSVVQAAAGARWFRCDVVAFGRGEGLLPLPRRKGVLAGVLSRDGLEGFGLCGTDAPGSRDFERVACRLRHSWQAFATIPLTGGKRYPGAASVRKAGDDACKDRARTRAADALKFRYGWEWPTADQWQAGQHFGYCWVPA